MCKPAGLGGGGWGRRRAGTASALRFAAHGRGPSRLQFSVGEMLCSGLPAAFTAPGGLHKSPAAAPAVLAVPHPTPPRFAPGLNCCSGKFFKGQHVVAVDWSDWEAAKYRYIEVGAGLAWDRICAAAFHGAATSLWSLCFVENYGLCARASWLGRNVHMKLRSEAARSVQVACGGAGAPTNSPARAAPLFMCCRSAWITRSPP